MIPGTLAKRYARALLSLAEDPAQRDRMMDDLDAVARACETKFGEGSETLTDVLCGVHHALSQRKAVAKRVCQQLAVDDKVIRLVDLLVDRGRISGAGQIARRYRELADEQAGRLKAKVVSARPLAADALAELKRCFEQATGRQITVETSVDPSLIGGLVTELGHQTIDLSVRSTLANLRHSLRPQPGGEDAPLPQ